MEYFQTLTIHTTEEKPGENHKQRKGDAKLSKWGVKNWEENLSCPYDGSTSRRPYQSYQ